MRNKKFLKYYVTFCLASFIIGLLLSSIFKSNNFVSSPPNLGAEFAFDVWLNNSKNFLSYLIFFIISPFLQFFDLCRLGIQIGISVQLLGLPSTLQGLLPHGLLEIPNFIWYQGMSQYILYQLWFEKDLVALIQREKNNLKWYAISYVVLVTSAIVEGWLG